MTILEKIELIGFDIVVDCHIWRGRKNDDGYGVVDYEGRIISVHRASWQAHRGPIPSGLCVLHSCDVRPCFNPGHLFLGTRPDNTADMDAKGRRIVLRGEDHGCSILTESQVRDIRSRPWSYGLRPKLASEFGVSISTISRVRCGRNWSHVG